MAQEDLPRYEICIPTGWSSEPLGQKDPTDFKRQFYPKEPFSFFFSNSGMNSLDCSIWRVGESKGCKKVPSSLRSLKSSITRSWNSLSREYLIIPCQSFCPSLETAIEKNGTLIES